MTKYMIIDTEGTGLFDYKKPADAEGQPRLAEIAILFVNEALEIEREYHALVKPDGWTMPEATTKIHGLTQEMLEADGVPVSEILTVYNDGISEGRVFVAHNQQHDGKQLRAELRRAGLADNFETSPGFCTMRNLTDVVKIPPLGNRGGYKWPKLSECCVFFGMDEFGDHTAMNDAKACLGLLRKMRELGLPLAGQVHYAKGRDDKEKADV